MTKTLNATFEQPEQKEIICPLCHRTIGNYLQDMFNHVMTHHHDKVKNMSTAEELTLFEKGFTWEASTNNPQP